MNIENEWDKQRILDSNSFYKMHIRFTYFEEKSREQYELLHLYPA